MFYYYYPLLSLSYIINIHYHHYYPPPLSSLFFIILSRYHPHPGSSSTFIILVLYYPQIHQPHFHHVYHPYHHQYQARCVGSARRGGKPRAPNNATPTRQNFEAAIPGKISPMCRKFPEKLLKVGKQTIPEFCAKWCQHKIHFPRNCRNFYKAPLQKSLNFKQNGLFQKAKKSWKFYQNGEKAKDLFFTSSGVAHASVFLGSICAFEFPRSFFFIII